MSTVRELLDEKGRSIFSIDASASVYDAVALLAEKNIGALAVHADGKPLAGIISERDYARKVMLKDRNSHEITVADIMTSDVIVAHEGTLVDSCMALMIQHKIRHLPVVEKDLPVGMITLGDIMKTIIREQSEAIEELESFIVEDQGGEG